MEPYAQASNRLRCSAGLSPNSTVTPDDRKVCIRRQVHARLWRYAGPTIAAMVDNIQAGA